MWKIAGRSYPILVTTYPRRSSSTPLIR
jgi:hypothetical protein